MPHEYSISTDKTLLDVGLIHDYLCNRSYWARGRSLEEVQRTIEHSVCFGLYADRKMAGFARAVTDRVVFAYLMDVFILEQHRGRGLGTMLVRHMLEHPDLQVRIWLLKTEDAHGLYTKLGFRKLDRADWFMERIT